MKIAMIHTPFLARTGGERQILTLALELQKLGHEVEIFTSFADKSTYPELFNKVKVNIYSIESKFPRVLNKANFLSMINIARKISKDFDIINNHNFPTEWSAFVAKNRIKAPIVWMCNEPPFWHLHPQIRKGLAMFGGWPLFSVFDKLAVRRIDEILALSNIGAKIIHEVYDRESRVVRSGVNVDFFHSGSGNIFRKRNGLENDFVLLQVGTLVYYKRQEDSITALAMLSKKHSNVKLVLDGLGDPKPLIALAQKLNVQDKIIFSHASSDEELAATYAACDVFIYPSDNTWGLVVPEAMAASKPVIVSKNSGASEIIQENINGFSVYHQKPTEIADRLELLISNPKLLNEIGDNAYNYVKNNLSWKKYAKDMENIFYNMLHN